MSRSQPSLSIVCVYNQSAVREHCLDRSIRAFAGTESFAGPEPDVEYLPIDNVNGTYPSAGAALNHGVSLARNDVVVFVHQDVYLHSIAALRDAAGHLRGDGFGVLGAVGVRSDGLLLGRIRDRIVLAGTPVERTAEVDSIDEVLFMAPRDQLLADPLTESPDLAWHAYAVEYGLRVRSRGLRTGVADIPLTHNSLSANMARLDEAHQAVARRHLDQLPVRTTCGTITSRTAGTERPAWLTSHRWRYRWLRDSMVVQGGRKLIGAAGPGVRMDSVLADMRRDVDAVLERAPGQRLHVINCNGGQPFARPCLPDGQTPLELRRHGGVVVFSDCGASELPGALAGVPSGAWTLISNLSEADLAVLEPVLPPVSGILGFHIGTGLWLLLGPAFTELPPAWRSRKATPLGPGALVGASFLRLEPGPRCGPQPPEDQGTDNAERG